MNYTISSHLFLATASNIFCREQIKRLAPTLHDVFVKSLQLNFFAFLRKKVIHSGKRIFRLGI